MRIEPGMIFRERYANAHILPAVKNVYIKVMEEKTSLYGPIFYVIHSIDHKKKEVSFDVYYSKAKVDHELKRAPHHYVRKAIQEGDWISGVEEEFTIMRAKHLLTYA
jgi:hypothetical protein